MASGNALKKIRDDVMTNVGRNVRVKANRGRKKTFIKEGVLENVYTNIFTVKVVESADFVRRLSYSYSDILTQTVELTVLPGQDKAKYCSM